MITINDLFQMVWKEHWSQQRYQVSGHANEVRLLYGRHIEKKFGHVEVQNCSVRDVSTWHKSLSGSPITANRALEVLSRMFNYALDHEYAGYNPCSRVKAFKERKRSRYASKGELQAIGENLQAHFENNPRGVTFLYTLLYTGARPRSIERATWDQLHEIQDGYGTLIFKGKTTEDTGELETVIIPPLVMTMIKSLPRVLYGPKKNLIFGINTPHALWYQIREKAGCPDLWIRDFRRTFATVGMSNGVKMDTIGELLNHKSIQTTKIYAKLDDSARLKAMEDIGKKLDEILRKGGK